jgi:hypothetical protein
MENHAPAGCPHDQKHLTSGGIRLPCGGVSCTGGPSFSGEEPRSRLPASDNSPTREENPLYEPVPDNVTCCGLPAALSVTFNIALRVPVAVGLKVTLMVQLAPVPKELPQPLVCA